MRIYIVLTTLLFTLLQAQTYKIAQDSCELYNDLKHKKNSFKKHLKIGESYRITREQDDHYYIYVPNITISNRWVEKSCFEEQAATKVTTETPVTKSAETLQKEESTIEKQAVEESPKVSTFSQKPDSLLLALSWQNSFCETHRHKRECHRNINTYKNDNRFVLHGLWPQPKDNQYCNVAPRQKMLDKNHQWNRIDKIDLNTTTRAELHKIMPGVSSNLHLHEWIKHGTCYSTSAEQYYSDAISLTKSVIKSKLGHFFTQNIGKVVTLQQIRFKADESFGKGSGKRVEMRCNQGMISELWFHLGYGGSDMAKLLYKGPIARSRCKSGLIDRAGF